MYKRSSHSQHYHSRTGSYSTRGSATGHVSVLPTAYDPLALRFLKPHEQFEQLRRNETYLAARLQQIEQRCLAARAQNDTNRHQALEQQRQSTWNAYNGLRASLGHLEAVIAAARWAAPEVTFFHLAKLMVDRSRIIQLEDRARDLLGRYRHEETVCATGDWPDEAKYEFGEAPEAVYAALQLRWLRAKARARSLHAKVMAVRREMARAERRDPALHDDLAADLDQLGQQMAELGHQVKARRENCKEWGEEVFCRVFRRLASDALGPWICKQIEDAANELSH